jgi:putative sterol carrier protein
MTDGPANVRELAPGLRRFTDPLDGPSGLSRNLLTERLRALEGADIIARKELPPPAARQVYRLTDDGGDSGHRDGRPDCVGDQADWRAQARRHLPPALAGGGTGGSRDREAANGVRENYQYLVDDSAFHFTVDNGSIELHDGRAEDPSVAVTTDEETWADIASGEITASSAAAAGALTIAGNQQAAKRMQNIFSRSPMLARAKATTESA